MWRALVLVAFFSLVQGCGYAPAAWKVGDHTYYVKTIDEGVTPKRDVVDILGKPFAEDEDNRILYYEGVDSRGVIVPLLWSSGREKSENDVWVAIAFDENDIVATIRTLEPQGLRTLADQGDVEAQYWLGIQQAILDKSKGFGWLCRAANQKYPSAQYAVGNWYRQQGESASVRAATFRPDDRVAFMWYSLAVSNGETLAAATRRKLTAHMTPAEIAEAERLAAEWTPDPTSCEIEAARATGGG